MALVKCAECGVDVSDQANACPSCGHPQIPVLNKKEKVIGAIGAFTAIGVIGIGLLFSLLTVVAFMANC